MNSAKSAAELIDIDYETLPAIADTAHALEADAPLVWPERGTNLAFEYTGGDKAATEAAFAKAAKVAELTIVNNRVVCNYMEPRAIVVEPGPSDHFTVTVGSQGVHGLRDGLCKVLKIDPQSLHVLTPDVGGGFGTKGFNYREYPLVGEGGREARPAGEVGVRPQRAFPRRRARARPRDNRRLALDANGRVLALDIDIAANIGSYFNQFGAIIPWFAIVMMTGLYDIQTVHAVCMGVFTHTVPTDAYRGAGRPEAAFLIERLMDEAARVTGPSAGRDPAAELHQARADALQDDHG